MTNTFCAWPVWAWFLVCTLDLHALPNQLVPRLYRSLYPHPAKPLVDWSSLACHGNSPSTSHACSGRAQSARFACVRTEPPRLAAAHPAPVLALGQPQPARHVSSCTAEPPRPPLALHKAAVRSAVATSGRLQQACRGRRRPSHPRAPARPLNSMELVGVRRPAPRRLSTTERRFADDLIHRRGNRPRPPI